MIKIKNIKLKTLNNNNNKSKISKNIKKGRKKNGNFRQKSLNFNNNISQLKIQNKFKINKLNIKNNQFKSIVNLKIKKLGFLGTCGELDLDSNNLLHREIQTHVHRDDDAIETDNSQNYEDSPIFKFSKDRQDAQQKVLILYRSIMKNLKEVCQSYEVAGVPRQDFVNEIRNKFEVNKNIDSIDEIDNIVYLGWETYVECLRKHQVPTNFINEIAPNQTLVETKLKEKTKIDSASKFLDEFLS